jgi:hypothetical protein
MELMTFHRRRGSTKVLSAVTGRQRRRHNGRSDCRLHGQ